MRMADRGSMAIGESSCWFGFGIVSVVVSVGSGAVLVMGSGTASVREASRGLVGN